MEHTVFALARQQTKDVIGLYAYIALELLEETHLSALLLHGTKLKKKLKDTVNEHKGESIPGQAHQREKIRSELVEKEQFSPKLPRHKLQSVNLEISVVYPKCE